MKPTRMVCPAASSRAARRATRRRNRCRRTRRRGATPPRMRSAERRERRLGVRQVVASSAVIELALQDELRRDLVAHARASARPRRPRRSVGCAIAVVWRSSTCATGRPKRARELAREALRARRSSRAACRRRAPAGRRRGAPAAIRRPARRSRRSACVRSQSRSSSADARCASSVLPTATPMRRVPKSNASTVAAGSGAHGRDHACPTSRTAARNRCRAAASRRAAARSAGRSNSTSGSASTVSQAFCASSCSSWPADQPA